MAQGTVHQRFLAPKAKTRSAAIAALLVGALALSGCGGDSEDSQTASAGPTAEREAAQQQGATNASAGDPSSPAGKAADQSGGGGQGSSPAASAPNPGSTKKAPPIALPEGEPEKAPTPKERAEATVADISLTSPVLSPGSEQSAPLPTAYTCDGKDSWPELRWSGVPAGTKELALFVMNIEPVKGELFFDWAITGIDPTLEAIEAGKLPKGAITGQNGFGQNGYSICPPKGTSETYLFALYALPESLPASRGFDPMALRTKVLEVSGNVGLLAAAYTR